MIKRILVSLGLAFSIPTVHAAFGPIITCPGPYACILSSYLGLQFPDGSQQTTAATSATLSIGTLDSKTPAANGAVATGTTLFLQSASGATPGLINGLTQTFAGDKTFTGNLESSANIIADLTLQGVNVLASSSVESPAFILVNGSQTIALGTDNATGTYVLKMPVSAGSAGSVLTTQGNGATMTWTPATSLSAANNVVIRDGSGNSFFGTASAGNLQLTGSSSGTINMLPQAAAGSWNFNLPVTAGNAGDVLMSGGGGSNPMTWGTASGRPSTPPVRQVFNTPGSTNLTVPTPVPLYARCLMSAAGGGSAGSGSSAGSGTAGGNTAFNTTQIQLSGGGAGGNNGTASAGGSAVVNSGSLTLSSLPFTGGGGSGVSVLNPSSGTVLVSGGNGGASIFGPGAPGQPNGTAVSASIPGGGAGGGGPNTIGPNMDASAGGAGGGGVDVLITAGFTAGQSIPLSIGSPGTAGSGGTGGWGGANGGPGQIVCDWYY